LPYGEAVGYWALALALREAASIIAEDDAEMARAKLGDLVALVLGAEGDRICSPEDVRATALHHDVEAVLVPGLAHMMMLERQWQRPARAIADWLATLE